MQSIPSLHLRIARAFADLRYAREPKGLYEPIDYTLGLGGKRLRPLLVLLACDIFGGDTEAAIHPAIGLEIFHNFTLLHDDIMDRAPIRRGQSTVHQKWDINTAILSGDTMFVIAYEYVARTDPKLLPEVLDLFNDTARKVCEGQQLDMEYELRTDVSVEDYMEMIRLKTAVLLACSLKLGALIAHASPADTERFYNLGIELGLAFQLQDDYLDAFGDPEKFGKAIGGDITSNKKTFLHLKAFESAGTGISEKLAALTVSTDLPAGEKIPSVLEIYRQLKVDEFTREKIAAHHTRALEMLASFGFPSSVTGELETLMQEMLGRER